MGQPGRPEKPDAFWYEIGSQLLGHYGIDPTLKGAILTILKPFILAFIAEVNKKETHSREEVVSLLRDHIYGWPKPGKS